MSSETINTQEICYHDYSSVVEEDLQEITRQSFGESGSKKMRRGPRGGVATPFPLKLHQLLEEHLFDDIISWLSHGRAFIMHRPQEFLDKVMTKYFKQTKLTSFQRQLNLYAFRRISSGPDKGAYYHELFLRGKPVLCNHIYRLRVKGNKIKSASCPDNEPNFYRIPPLKPNSGNDTKYVSEVSEDETVSSLDDHSRNHSYEESESFGNEPSQTMIKKEECDVSSTWTHESDQLHNLDGGSNINCFDQVPNKVVLHSTQEFDNPTFLMIQCPQIDHTVEPKAVEFAGKEFFYLDSMDRWDICDVDAGGLPLGSDNIDPELTGLSLVNGELCGFESV